MVAYLQVRDFDEKATLIRYPEPSLPIETIPESHFLKQGDVVFAAKGNRHFAWSVTDLSLPTVASTSFFVLRLLNRDVLPDYLAWILNTKIRNGEISQLSTGTSIPSITKEMLGDLEISVPSIATQRSIVTIKQLWEREQALRREIEDQRKKLIDCTILNLLR